MLEVKQLLFYGHQNDNTKTRDAACRWPMSTWLLYFSVTRGGESVKNNSNGSYKYGRPPPQVLILGALLETDEGTMICCISAKTYFLKQNVFVKRKCPQC